MVATVGVEQRLPKGGVHSLRPITQGRGLIWKRVFEDVIKLGSLDEITLDLGRLGCSDKCPY